jgi:hypothetical protein
MYKRTDTCTRTRTHTHAHVHTYMHAHMRKNVNECLALSASHANKQSKVQSTKAMLREASARIYSEIMIIRPSRFLSLILNYFICTEKSERNP